MMKEEQECRTKDCHRTAGVNGLCWKHQWMKDQGKLEEVERE